MLARLLILSSILLFASVSFADDPKSLYSVPLKTLEGKSETLEQYRGKVLLLVNTASKCGFTPQYRDLQALYEKYKEQGLVVLGFPSNDFMKQEPGSNEEIKQFCKLRFEVNFPLFEKGSVTGELIQPLYRTVLESAPDELKGAVMWNFEKIVIDEKGGVRGRFSSVVNPLNARVTDLIEKLLTEKS